MRTPFITLLTFALSAFTSACSMSTEKVDAKKNPDPKMRYEVTLTIDNAPGPFDSITGLMEYEVTNRECVPVTGAPMNPLRLPPKEHPEIQFIKVADNVYKGAVYGDYFQDEDYFGLGACHWSLTSVTTSLNVNKLSFIPRLSPDQLFSKKSATTYFVYRIRKNGDSNMSDFGEPSPSEYRSDRQKEVFSVTLSSKEVFE